jgi:hypothetical protein
MFSDTYSAGKSDLTEITDPSTTIKKSEKERKKR